MRVGHRRWTRQLKQVVPSVPGIPDCSQRPFSEHIHNDGARSASPERHGSVSWLGDTTMTECVAQTANGCIVCAIVAGRAEASVVYEEVTVAARPAIPGFRLADRAPDGFLRG